MVILTWFGFNIIVLLLFAKAIFVQADNSENMDSAGASPGSSISGTLLSSDGSPGYFSPIDKIEVQLYDALMQQITTTIIRNDGSFSFKNLRSGEYFINISYTYDHPAAMYYDHPVAVSLEENESKNIGRQQLLKFSTMKSDVWVIDVKTVKLMESEWTALFPRELDSRYPVTSSGNKVLTVCQYLKMRTNYPLAYVDNVIIIGNLVQTPEGSWLQQSCGNPVKAGAHIWPDAISLNDVNVHKQGVDRYVYDLKETDYLHGRNYIQSNSSDDIVAVAVIGRLTTSDNLVYVKCGEEKTCGFGYGPIAAPAQIIYWSIRQLTGDVDLLK